MSVRSLRLALILWILLIGIIWPAEAQTDTQYPLISPENATQIALISTIQAHPEEVSSVAFSGDGTYLVSAGWDRAVRRWELATGQSETLLEPADLGFVSNIGVSQEGNRIAAGTPLGELWVWDVESLAEVVGLTGLATSTSGSAVFHFTEDGGKVAFGSAFGNIDLSSFDSEGNVQSIAQIDAHSGAIFALAFSPDGTLLASGSTDDADTTVKLWNTETGAVVQEIEAPSYINTLAFSPDGTLLAAGSGDPYEATTGAIHLWSVETGEEIAILSGHAGGVTKVVFSPLQPLLASGSADNTIRLWNIADNSLLTTLSGAVDWIRALAFAADGTLLASGSRDGNVQLWAVADTEADISPTAEGVTASQPDENSNRSSSDSSDTNSTAETGEIVGIILGIGLLLLIPVAIYRRLRRGT